MTREQRVINNRIQKHAVNLYVSLPSSLSFYLSAYIAVVAFSIHYSALYVLSLHLAG